jgi:hypothetical protein
MTTNITTTDEQLTSRELAEARQILEQAQDGLLATTRAFSDAQWSYKPAADVWSAAEVLEHIVIIQERVLGPVSEALAQSPETPSENAHVIDGIIKTIFADRSRKFKGPEFVWPKSQWRPAESLERLVTNTARLIQRLRPTCGGDAFRRRHCRGFLMGSTRSWTGINGSWRWRRIPSDTPDRSWS